MFSRGTRYTEVVGSTLELTGTVYGISPIGRTGTTVPGVIGFLLQDGHADISHFSKPVLGQVGLKHLKPFKTATIREN